jgi:SAM-dependent methyltransferase
LLQELQADGFTDLTGADPFIDWDLDYGPGLKILKTDLSRLDRQFSLIMLHHSLEHMPEPAAIFGELHRLTRSGGRLLIRIPVADSRAWRDYGVDWVQLDAPRHLYLHTRRSLELLAQKAGFGIDRVEHDSTAFQFWGSELYRRDIPLRDVDDDGREGEARFQPAELADFSDRAEALNASGTGDQAVFFLRRL